MKRRYKAGDWLRVPLGGEQDALALIARACRSRLFGYFFAFPAGQTPSHDDLRALGPQDALCALLFGGAPIERARWELIATSLAFEPHAWPFPVFASRGAFGDAWTQVRYDPATLQIVERRGIQAAAAAALPDARFADAHQIETLLRGHIEGSPASRAASILELRSPIDPERLRALEYGGRIQFSTPLLASDLETIAQFVQVCPHVELRVHGFRRGFDAASLSRMTALRHLALDVHRLQHAGALRELRALQSLRIGSVQLAADFLDALTNLQTLELRGTRAALEPVQRLASLRALVLENTAPLDLRTFAGAERLESLTLAHGDYDLREVHRLVYLRRLELRALDAHELPVLESLARLEHLEITALAHVTDLTPLASAGALRDLRIAAMPHLNVGDFEPLQACAGLRSVDIDVGSARKEREIYRLIKPGNTYEL